MSLDGIAIRSLVDELSPLLIGGRIDKIHQPDGNTVLLNIRQPGQSLKLLISIHPQTARFHLTKDNKKNPTQPPLFCMVLRKHLEGSKIIKIEQQGLERVVHFICEGFDELGDKSQRILIGEFMGKHSNLILINPETNTIMDSIKRLSMATNHYRQVLPGVGYMSPPPQEKISVEDITEPKLMEQLLSCNPDKAVPKALLEILSGIGPQTAKELTIRSNLNLDTKIEFLGEYEYAKLWQQTNWLQELLRKKEYEPTLVSENNSPLAFAPFSLQQFAGLEQKKFQLMSELIQLYIGQKEDSNTFKQKALDLEKVINRELERCERKLVIQLNKIADGQKAEKYKIWGELLTANLYHLSQGSEAEVTNFYSENQETIKIPLEANLTPNENAQKYFKKYNKAKIGAEKSLEQSLETKEEIRYLESITNNLATAETLEDLQEIRLELEETGYLKAKLTKNKKKTNSKTVPQPIFVDIEGFRIYVGKNNKQNDYLTLKLAKNNDLWLHVKDMPGSHVIIKNPEQNQLPQHILDTAANLAAYFSKGRNSAQVPVDYTLKRNVKKPNGAKPGMVIYDNQKTIYITPDEDRVKQMIH